LRPVRMQGTREHWSALLIRRVSCRKGRRLQCVTALGPSLFGPAAEPIKNPLARTSGFLTLSTLSRWRSRLTEA
jgi:hypothetical protein